MLGSQSSGLDLGITHSIHTRILLYSAICRGGNHQKRGLTKAKPDIATTKTPFLDIYRCCFENWSVDLDTLFRKLLRSMN